MPHSNYAKVLQPRFFPKLSLALVVLGCLALVVDFDDVSRIATYSGVEVRESETVLAPAAVSDFGLSDVQLGLAAATGYRRETKNIPISDTREFLKTDYTASIQTRQVEDVGEDIAILVRGLGGRIDTISLGSRSGYLSFVLPKDQFEVFKYQVKGMIPERFLEEYVGRQNMLGEKRSLEEEKTQLEKAVQDYEIERRNLVRRHQSVLFQIQKELDRVQEDIAMLEKKEDITPDVRDAERERLLKQRASIERRQRSENSTYDAQLRRIDTVIGTTKNSIEQVVQKDLELVDTVATVQGNVSLQWISIFEMITRYIPKQWLSILLFSGAFLLFLRGRRRTSLEAVLP